MEPSVVTKVALIQMSRIGHRHMTFAVIGTKFLAANTLRLEITYNTIDFDYLTGY